MINSYDSYLVVTNFYSYYQQLIQSDPVLVNNLIYRNCVVVELDEYKLGKCKFNRVVRSPAELNAHNKKGHFL